MNSSPQSRHDRIIARLRQEFLVDARERIDLIERALAADGSTGSGVLVTIRREVHNLKGLAGSFGFPAVGLIAHRLEDYVSELESLEARHRADITVFIDRLADIVDAGQDPGDGAAGEIVRGLPAHPGFEIAPSAARSVEVLLVAPSKAVSQIAVRALRALGYRVTTARTAWEAIEIAVRTRPDLIITSAVMAGASGIDLVRALATMTATQGLPVAVMTSFSKDHPELLRLPPQVPVIRLGDSFEADLAEIVTGVGLA